MDGELAIKESRREQKRRDTRLRIAEEGLRLFDQDGYDATTLEAVAAAAGVSARTLFHYFRTKYDVLEFWHDRGFEQALPSALLAEPDGQKPLPTVRDCLLKLVPRYQTDRLVTVDRIRHSTDTLRADKQMVYFRMEDAVFAALCERWPQPEQRPALRVAAMISIGALRLAMEARRQDGDGRDLTDHLKDVFCSVAEMSRAG
jgi:AcrR family transcriptional regulator